MNWRSVDEKRIEKVEKEAERSAVKKKKTKRSRVLLLSSGWFQDLFLITYSNTLLLYCPVGQLMISR